MYIYTCSFVNFCRGADDPSRLLVDNNPYFYVIFIIFCACMVYTIIIIKTIIKGKGKNYVLVKYIK